MKKVILFVIFLISSFTLCAQNNANLTSGKWKIDSIEIESEVIDVKNEGHWMVFYPDGLYQLYLENEEQVGTWKFDKEIGLRFDDELANANSSIEKLNGDELKFSISGFRLALSK